MNPTLIDARRGQQLETLGNAILRLGLAFLLALFGIFKFFQFEADAIQPLVSHSPLVGWLYGLFSVRPPRRSSAWWRSPRRWVSAGALVATARGDGRALATGTFSPRCRSSPARHSSPRQ
jgi:hypothetical protein